LDDARSRANGDINEIASMACIAALQSVLTPHLDAPRPMHKEQPAGDAKCLASAVTLLDNLPLASRLPWKGLVSLPAWKRARDGWPVG
jgi:hypothetical protein